MSATVTTEPENNAETPAPSPAAPAAAAETAAQRSFGPYTCQVTRSYVKLKCLYLGKKAVRDSSLPQGPVSISLDGDDEFRATGVHAGTGGVTGLAKLYASLGLMEGDTLTVRILRSGIASQLTITTEKRAVASAVGGTSAARVFEQKKLRHVHLEPFRPENLLSWEPAEEKDVYLAFGVLQEYSDFRYCCSTSMEVLRKLGCAEVDGVTKPDAVLIDLRTDEYVLSEWKMRSSAFASNHKAEDVDVLVCWYDDENDRAKLPRDVICLRDIARTAATSILSDEELSE